MHLIEDSSRTQGTLNTTGREVFITKGNRISVTHWLRGYTVHLLRKDGTRKYAKFIKQ